MGTRVRVLDFAVKRFDGACRAAQGIAAIDHRRRAGVRDFSVEHDRHFPGHPGSRDSRDIRGRAFQLVALLDMKLDIAHRFEFQRRRAAIADPSESIAKRDAVTILAGIGLFQRQAPGEYCAACQAGLKTCALLIGPVRNRKIASGPARIGDGTIPHRLDGEESCQHAVTAVIAAARRLGVEVRAGDHDILRCRRQHRDTEHVSDRIDPWEQPAIAEFAQEEIACRLVGRRRRQPADAAVFGCTDCREGRDEIMQFGHVRTSDAIQFDSSVCRTLSFMMSSPNPSRQAISRRC